jgi:hypothetical protein
MAHDHRECPCSSRGKFAAPGTKSEAEEIDDEHNRVLPLPTTGRPLSTVNQVHYALKGGRENPREPCRSPATGPDIDHDHARVIHDLDTGDARYTQAYQFGQSIYTPWHASIYEATSLRLLGSWTHEPINGRISQVKQCARALPRLTNWPEIVAQAATLPHDISHALIEQVNALVLGAG